MTARPPRTILATEGATVKKPKHKKRTTKPAARAKPPSARRESGEAEGEAESGEAEAREGESQARDRCEAKTSRAAVRGGSIAKRRDDRRECAARGTLTIIADGKVATAEQEIVARFSRERLSPASTCRR